MAFTVFISYAHKDQKLRDKLDTHLSPLRRQGLIEDWYDGDIIAGQPWETAILTQLNTAHIILLLVSPDFLNSSFCYDVEMERALQRDEQGEAVVVPIILRPVIWQDAPFAKLQALPKGAKPVTKWSLRDEAFVDIAHGIRQAIDRLQKTQGASLSSRQRGNREDVFVQKTFWNVPPRNPFFTGREHVITHLYQLLHTHQTVNVTQPPALSGLGGIGKTQTAIEYAYRYRDSYQHIFWVRAETHEELATDFIAIAHLLALPEQDEQDQTMILQAVKHWLETHPGWLLILDNADDLAIVAPHLPQQSPGHLLLTTRASVMGGIAKKIQLETMQQEDGVLLLLRRAGIVADDSTIATLSEQTLSLAQTIVDELGGLPLALDQAGAYIEETSTNLTRYLALYRSQAEHRKQLLARRGGVIPSHPSAASTTISLAAQKITATNPHAKAILEICAFLSAEAIPEFLLIEGAAHFGPDLQAGFADSLTFDAALEVLLKYSLLQRDATAQQLTMHRLVQVVLKDDMSHEAQHQWAKRIIKAINSVFPGVDVETYAPCQQLLPHALVCATLIEDFNLDIPEAVQLLNQTSDYLNERAQYAEAIPLLQRALAIREKVCGPEHPNTAASLHCIADLYREQGKYEQAEAFHLRGLAIREKVYGPEHPNTATSLDSLAILYQKQGKYEQAEAFHLRELTIREKTLGCEHPTTTTTLHNLAHIYQRQGKYEQAEAFHLHELTIREKVCGPEHSDTAASLHCIADLYLEQGKYEQAEAFHLRELTIREKVYGSEHPNTATTLHNLAHLYQEQGKYEQAESFYLRALDIREHVLSPEHPAMATTLQSLADLYREQGKYEQAEPFYLRALDICEHVLGPEHPATGANYHILSRIYEKQGKYEQAESFYLRALDIREHVLGPEHPDTATTLHNLADLYQEQDKYEQAESFHLRELAIREKVFGPEHLTTAGSLHCLANLYQNQGNYAEAVSLSQRVVAIREKVLGVEHPDTAKSLNHLALLYDDQGNYAEAVPLLQRALAIFEQVLGPEHPNTKTVLANYSAVRARSKHG